MNLRTISPPRDGLSYGIVWNLFSLAFLAAAGIALNVAIGRIYGPGALGTFNISFSLFIFFSQFAAFGLHLSIMQVASFRVACKSDELALAIGTGFGACIISALCTSLSAWALTPAITNIYRHLPDLEAAWLILVPGLFFFALNKFLFGVINGMAHMRAFAVFQSMRYVFVMLVLIGLMLLQRPGFQLTATLTIAEILLFPVLIFYVLRKAGFRFSLRSSKWWQHHFLFGTRVFASGIAGEINTRVDILLIGYFMNEMAVGIYTIAALAFEALSQVIAVVRTNLNPLLARYIAGHDKAALLQLSRKSVAVFSPLMLITVAAIISIYPTLLTVLFPDQDFRGSFGALIILLIALSPSAGLMSFNMMFSQAGRPGLHSLFNFIVLAINIAGGITLIPHFGLIGAALGTALATLASGFLVIPFARSALGIRILF